MFGHTKKAVEMPADDGDAAGGEGLRYAGFWARVAALIVDLAIITIFGLALIVGAPYAGDAAALVATAVYVLVALLYWPVMECSALQATYGKQMLGIQVTDLEGGRLSFVHSLLRNVAKILSLIPLPIGFVLAGFTARKQALHDMIASCLVVRLGPSHRFRAAAASVVGLIVTIGGAYYYVLNLYQPHQISMARAPLQEFLDKALQGAKGDAPAPAPQPAAATPPAPTPEPQVAVVIPEAPPATAPVPAPAPTFSAELVSEPPVDKPRPARRAAAPRPAVETAAPIPAAAPRPVTETAAPVPAAPPRKTVTPKYNDVMTAVMYRDPEGIVELLDLGWWVDKPDSNDVTPLMAAAWEGDAALVKLLLQRGADPNRHAPGGSVLEYAKRYSNGKVIELLKAAGAR